MKDYEELKDIKDSAESLINSAFNEGYDQGFEDGTENVITKRLIENLLESYKDEVDEMREYRRKNPGINLNDAMTTGKIGAYGRVIADLTELLESEGEV